VTRTKKKTQRGKEKFSIKKVRYVGGGGERNVPCDLKRGKDQKTGLGSKKKGEAKKESGVRKKG